MEFSFEDQARSQTSSQGVASDRLRKAIERNRAKQVKRSSRSHQEDNQTNQSKIFQASSKGRAWSPPGTKKSSTVSSSGLRKGVARADEEAEFSSDLKRPSRAATSRARTKAEYLPAKSTPRRRVVKRKKQTDKDFIHYLVVGSWIFCGALLLRLIFSSGGVVDYYNNKARLDSRHMQYSQIVQENKDLRVEIDQIRNSSAYQRQLLRDHLGYIASDEYLVIFPGRSSGPSI